MIRGTTPTLKFTLPFEANNVIEAWITFSQNKNIILDKTFDDCSIDDKVIILVLSQEDTLSLDPRWDVDIQIRIKTADNKVIASNIFSETVDRILKDGEM